jgi:outer membrane protein assembly factor BamB
MNFRTRPILLLILAVAAGTTVCHGADWPAFRGNLARTGCYPDPVGFPSGAAAWKLSLNCEIVSSPVVAGDLLYIGARDSCIYAVECGSGSVRWKRKTGGWVDASPLIDGNRVIIGSRDSIIYVLERNSGDLLGTLRAGVQLSSPVITAAGEILTGIGLPGKGIRAFGGASLAKRLAEPQWSIDLPQFTYSSPAVHGQAVVIGATDGKLYGIDEGRRDTIWSLSTGGTVYLSTPAIDDTTVYFAPGDADRNVYAVNLLTGKVAWKSAPASPVNDTLNAMAKKKNVKLFSYMDRVNLLNMSPEIRKRTIVRLRSNGIALPRVPMARGLARIAAGGSSVFIPLGGMKTSSVAVGQDNVCVIQKELGYVLTNDSVVDYKQRFAMHSLDKMTGAEQWSFADWRGSPLLGYCSSPVVTNNLVIFGWGEGRVYALDLHTGALLWSDTLAGDIISSPAIANGELFIATMAGNVYCFKLMDTPPGLDFKRSTYCYPNPARGKVLHIQVYVNDRAECAVATYNAAEKPVFRLNRTLAAGGKYTYDWDLGDVANGAYIAIVKVAYAGGRSEKKVLKIAVLR